MGAVIVDLIDMNRVLVSGAATGRIVTPMRRLELTPYKVPIQRGMGHKKVMDIFKKSNVVALFRNSNRGRQILKQKMKRTMTDFERFELQLLKKEEPPYQEGVQCLVGGTQGSTQEESRCPTSSH